MKTYIWTISTRVFHWLFAFFIIIAFLTDDDELLSYHAIIGYSILILLLFRVYWGVWGPKHSKFSDFPFGLNSLKEFFKNISNSHKEYLGHNPAASYVMLGIYITTFLTIITGIFAFGIQEGKGILSFLTDSFLKKMELFEKTHEILSSLLIILILFHLLGLLSDRFLHPNNETLKSIFTGYKNIKKEENIKSNILQKVISLIFLIIFISFLIFSLLNKDNFLLISKYEVIDDKIKHKESYNNYTKYRAKEEEKLKKLIKNDNFDNKKYKNILTEVYEKNRLLLITKKETI